MLQGPKILGIINDYLWVPEGHNTSVHSIIGRARSNRQHLAMLSCYKDWHFSLLCQSEQHQPYTSNQRTYTSKDSVSNWLASYVSVEAFTIHIVLLQIAISLVIYCLPYIFWPLANKDDPALPINALEYSQFQLPWKQAAFGTKFNNVPGRFKKLCKTRWI